MVQHGEGGHVQPLHPLHQQVPGAIHGRQCEAWWWRRGWQHGRVARQQHRSGGLKWQQCHNMEEALTSKCQKAPNVNRAWADIQHLGALTNICTLAYHCVQTTGLVRATVCKVYSLESPTYCQRNVVLSQHVNGPSTTLNGINIVEMMPAAQGCATGKRAC